MEASSRQGLEAIVVGHLCLDIYPGLAAVDSMQSILTPGALFSIGPATVATGGAVPNTGIALHRLGIKTRLMSKVGDDALGGVVMQLLAKAGEELPGGMIVARGANGSLNAGGSLDAGTSYTIVLNPPTADRTFWHHTGCNDTFTQSDVTDAQLDAARDAGARLMHFGYPGLMRQIYSDGGTGLLKLFQRAKARGLTTSLDMVRVDPNGDAGRVDWPKYLQRVLPAVDLFVPSIDEVQLMFDRNCDCNEWNDRALSNLAGRLLEMGPAAVALKLGERGLYLRTSGSADRIAAMGSAAPRDGKAWIGRELLTTCFKVKLAGATGAGDCTIAGLLAALLRGLNPEEAMQIATGAGACSVEVIDATAGVPDWHDVQRRIAAGWEKHPIDPDRVAWKWDNEHKVARGPNDRRV